MSEGGVDRRTFLKGSLALAGTTLLSTEAKAVAELFHTDATDDIPRVENVKEFQKWFRAREEKFKEVISSEHILEILNGPIDLNFDIKAFDEVMQILLKNWPYAYGAYVKHLPLHDVEDASGHLPAQLIHVTGMHGEKWRGNGAFVTHNHENKFLTAAHVLDGSAIPFSSPKQGGDIALTDIHHVKKNPETRLMPLEEATSDELRGSIVTIAGYDDDEGNNDNKKKQYVSASLPVSPRVALWIALYGDIWADTNDRKRIEVKRLNWIHRASDRDSLLPYFIQLSNAYSLGNMVRLPPGETLRDDHGDDRSNGMSGSPVVLNKNVIGAFTSGLPIYTSNKRYAIGAFNSNITGLLSASGSA